MTTTNPQTSTDAQDLIPPFPWLDRLTRDRLSTTRGFVFQFPPFGVLDRWDESSQPVREQGLYAHVPFCPYRCSYCYYAVEINRNGAAIDRYLDVLEVDMARAAARPAVADRAVTTAFIGGGTPTYLDESQLARLVGSLSKAFDLRALTEFSIEAEPTTVTPGKAAVLAESGVNRVSMGVQTFNDELNKLNHRDHSEAQVLAALDALRGAGIDNINLDLICGLIGETSENWRASVTRLLELNPEHVTIYLFSLRPQTISFAQIGQNKVPLPPDEAHRIEMFRWGRDALLAAGYVQTSANCYAREPKYEQIHQRNAWSNVPLVGLGNSAYSYVDGCVTQNHRAVARYSALLTEGRTPVEIGGRLDSREIMIRYCVLRLKLLSIDRAEFSRLFGFDVHDVIGAELAELCELGLVTVDEQAVRLTEWGIVYVDDVCRRIYTPAVRRTLAAGEQAASPLVTSLL